ncbi:hypothetical protein ACFPVY_09840 [Flavobacterium qiangtangense]|uniref:YcxB family protein n=1 Tax=Flavobacterium qiangtangense TaxID=1442595 RepID=A0ABW1PNY4_9FLAO
MEKEIIIVYKPTLESLTRVSKHLLYSLPFIKFMPFFVLIVILFNRFPQIMGLENNLENQNNEILEITLALLILSIVWGFIYFKTLSTMKKNILSNKRNLETQNIILSNKSYIQEGETFKVENFWSETYQIRETKLWFLIYPNKFSAFPIIKSNLEDNQYQELKTLFNSLDIKKKLKS